jgi:hypothetical protein
VTWRGICLTAPAAIAQTLARRASSLERIGLESARSRCASLASCSLSAAARVATFAPIASRSLFGVAISRSAASISAGMLLFSTINPRSFLAILAAARRAFITATAPRLASAAPTPRGSR